MVRTDNKMSTFDHVSKPDNHEENGKQFAQSTKIAVFILSDIFVSE